MQEQRMLQDASMLTHLVMLYQVFLIVPDFCCQNGHWVETHQVRVNSRVLKTQTCFNCRFLRKPDLILRRAAHPGLPLSCGRSHLSGLWQLAVPFSAAAFHSEEMMRIELS